MPDFSKYNLAQNGIPTDIVKPVQGQNAIRTLCPKCSAGRKTAQHRNEPVLYVNLDNGYCHCYHCGASWRMDSIEYLKRKEDKEFYKLSGKAKALAKTKTIYKRPVVANSDFDQLMSDAIMKYITETRGISMEVINQMCVTSKVEYMPQTQKPENCIVFNYFEQGVLINQKFRDLSKNFKMVQGAELIPYNIDSCLGEEEVIVVEGEFDAMAFVMAGFKSVISVPAGANSNTDWMNSTYDVYLSDKKRVYIATDMDAPGIKMAEELIRRFGPEVCYLVKFSEGCKDANDELLKNGVEGLRQRIEEAKPVPMPDIKEVGDFEDALNALYQNGPVPGKTTGWKNLDKVVTFGTGQLALVTGRSNDGKSEWLDELMVRLMLRTGWNAGYWTPENTILEHSCKIIEKLTDRKFGHKGDVGVQPDQFERCKQWMKTHLAWIDLPFDQLYIDIILERCRSLVRKYGIRLLVLDPFNFIEKENIATRNENNWDSHVVGAISTFAKKYDVLVFLVAHPRKVEMQVDGRKRRITMEDISGTADFGNKADYCFCVDRDDEHHVVTISIDKVRRKQYGTKGKQAHFVYITNSGRYCPCELDANKYATNTDYKTDRGMWLKPLDLFGNEDES